MCLRKVARPILQSLYLAVASLEIRKGSNRYPFPHTQTSVVPRSSSFRCARLPISTLHAALTSHLAATALQGGLVLSLTSTGVVNCSVLDARNWGIRLEKVRNTWLRFPPSVSRSEIVDRESGESQTHRQQRVLPMRFESR